MREPTIPRHVTQEFGRQITQLRVENARLRAVLEGLVRDWLPCRDLSVARWTGSFERCGKCAPCLAASDAAAAVAHSEDVGDGDLFVRTRDDLALAREVIEAYKRAWQQNVYDELRDWSEVDAALKRWECGERAGEPTKAGEDDI